MVQRLTAADFDRVCLTCLRRQGRLVFAVPQAEFSSFLLKFPAECTMIEYVHHYSAAHEACVVTAGSAADEKLTD